MNLLIDAMKLFYDLGSLMEISDMHDPFIEPTRPNPIHHRFIGAVIQEIVVSLTPLLIVLSTPSKVKSLSETIHQLEAIAGCRS